MSETYILGASHAAVYAKHRPTTPQELTDKILQYLQEKISPPFTSAVDVGCGSGQGTLILSQYFQHVLGTDFSQRQISEARKLAENAPNVMYSVSMAEEQPMENSTVQLITASQCFHYFDSEKFYQEAKRILVPNGVLAVYAYMLPSIKTDNEEKTQKVLDHLMELYTGPLDVYFDPVKIMVDQRYDTVKLPFSDTMRVNGIWSSKSCSVADYQGYLSTWSAYQGYAKDKGKQAGEALLNNFTKRLLEILQSSKNAEETLVQVDTEYFLLLGRNDGSKTVQH